MQFVSVLFLLAVAVFIMYYLPLISKDLHKITNQNELIIKLLEKKPDKEDEK
ncbi:hypothetical protein [Bacillus sp. T3]|uniref:hypothetical protein n=1 Tax=Bacillus sp. T3 TaxID=467262 RepID=UPI002980B5CF|nr:hypothetical protein [Bacillus sp. T3]